MVVLPVLAPERKRTKGGDESVKENTDRNDSRVDIIKNKILMASLNLYFQITSVNMPSTMKKLIRITSVIFKSMTY